MGIFTILAVGKIVSALIATCLFVFKFLIYTPTVPLYPLSNSCTFLYNSLSVFWAYTILVERSNRAIRLSIHFITIKLYAKITIRYKLRCFRCPSIIKIFHLSFY